MTDQDLPANGGQAEEPAQAPQQDAPENGISAGKALLEYAEALAKYTEEVGDTIFAQGESFRKECQVLAAGYRESAGIEAKRAVDFTVRMRSAGQAMQELKAKFDQASGTDEF